MGKRYILYCICWKWLHYTPMGKLYDIVLKVIALYAHGQDIWHCVGSDCTIRPWARDVTLCWKWLHYTPMGKRCALKVIALTLCKMCFPITVMCSLWAVSLSPLSIHWQMRSEVTKPGTHSNTLIKDNNWPWNSIKINDIKWGHCGNKKPDKFNYSHNYISKYVSYQ